MRGDDERVEEVGLVGFKGVAPVTDVFESFLGGGDSACVRWFIACGGRSTDEVSGIVALEIVVSGIDQRLVWIFFFFVVSCGALLLVDDDAMFAQGLLEIWFLGCLFHWRHPFVRTCCERIFHRRLLVLGSD